MSKGVEPQTYSHLTAPRCTRLRIQSRPPALPLQSSASARALPPRAHRLTLALYRSESSPALPLARLRPLSDVDFTSASFVICRPFSAWHYLLQAWTLQRLRPLVLFTRSAPTSQPERFTNSPPSFTALFRLSKGRDTTARTRALCARADADVCQPAPRCGLSALRTIDERIAAICHRTAAHWARHQSKV